LLDGTHDRDALIAETLSLLSRDVIRFERDGRLLTTDVDLRAAAEEHVDTLPLRLAQMKLWRLAD
jgi:hypothetical protein